MFTTVADNTSWRALCPDRLGKFFWVVFPSELRLGAHREAELAVVRLDGRGRATSTCGRWFGVDFAPAGCQIGPLLEVPTAETATAPEQPAFVVDRDTGDEQ